MTRVVRIAMPVPLHRSFDYSVPAGMAAPAIGARVQALLNNRSLTGVCVGRDPPDAHASLKPLLAVLDQAHIMTDETFALARWLSDYYHHPLGEVFATMLPTLAMKGLPLVRRTEKVWCRTSGEPPNLARAPRQQALIGLLEARGGWAGAAEIRAAGFTSPMIAALAKKGAIETGARPYELEEPPQLTAEQRAALDAYRQDVRGFSSTLLDGVTGSGKTEVYLQAMADVLARGEQVLVLVPEIALTPQTVGRFRRRYGETDVFHSNLTDRERLTAWLRCRDGDARILIGTRSAVLTPFKRLGLIVVDEEHDGSFKQQEGLRYSARDVAVKRAQSLDTPLILGSATPSLETLRNARTGRYRYQRLTERATGAVAPRLQVLDIRGHRLQDGLSLPLTKHIERHLRARGQVLVFLNRRGYAPVYLCAGCGWQACCKACDARLTLHHVPAGLTCHHCGARAPVPPECPGCGTRNLIAVGAGTQRTEAGLREQFPDLPLYRIDRRHHPQPAAAGRTAAPDSGRRPGNPGRHPDARQGPPLPQRHAGGRAQCGCGVPERRLQGGGTNRPAHRAGGGPRRPRRASRRGLDSIAAARESGSATTRGRGLHGFCRPGTRHSGAGRHATGTANGADPRRVRRCRGRASLPGRRQEQPPANSRSSGSRPGAHDAHGKPLPIPAHAAGRRTSASAPGPGADCRGNRTPISSLGH